MIDGSDLFGKSLNRDFNEYKTRTSTTLKIISRWVLVLHASRAKPRATSPRSDGQRDHVNLLSELWPSLFLLEDFSFSKALSRSSLSWFLHPEITKGLSLLIFDDSDSLRDFHTCFPCSTLNNSRSVESFQTLCASCNNSLYLPLLRLLLRLQIRLALLLLGSTNPNQLLDERE
jgi:hypothetical protein